MAEHTFVYKCIFCSHKLKSDHPYRERCPACGKRQAMVLESKGEKE